MRKVAIHGSTCPVWESLRIHAHRDLATHDGFVLTVEVTYNFQMHQMFFALQPERAKSVERAKLLKTPEVIKVIHFSGYKTPLHIVYSVQASCVVVAWNTFVSEVLMETLD